MSGKFNLFLLVFRRPTSIGLKLHLVTLGYYKEGVTVDELKKKKQDILDFFKEEAKKYLGGQGIVVTPRPYSWMQTGPESVFLSDVVLVAMGLPRQVDQRNLPPILGDFELSRQKKMLEYLLLAVDKLPKPGIRPLIKYSDQEFKKYFVGVV